MFSKLNSSKLLNKLVPIAEELTKVELRVEGTIPAGFPSEAFNYTEKLLDLNTYLAADKKFTNCLWACEQFHLGEGIAQGDLLVINTNNPSSRENVHLYWINEFETFALARAEKRSDKITLVFLNTDLAPMTYGNGEIVKSFGTLKFAVKKLEVYNRLLSGFPQEAYSLMDKGIDFNQYLIGLWETNFFLWSGGESMNGDGINKGDLLLIDKLRDPSEKDILAFYMNKEFTLKRMVKYKDHVELVASNPEMPPIVMQKGVTVSQWGTLTSAIKHF